MPNWYSLEVVTPPEEEPVAPAELREHLSLNVALPAVQDLLSLYIATARQQFEFETGRTAFWRAGWFPFTATR